jgi:predicted acyl esterase
VTEKHSDIEMIQERDVPVRMRDGVHLSVDVYRPSAAGRYPVLFASALHNKDIKGRTFPKSFRHNPHTLRFGLVL